MIAPKIISIGTALPPNSYTQEQVWNALGYTKPHFKRIFMDADIEKRYFWVDFESARSMSWQQLQEEYFKGAMALSEISARECIDEHSLEKVAGVSYVSCTGYQCPSVAHHLALKLPFREDVQYTNILGMGCEGGFPGLKRAYDFTKASGKQSLVIDTELCSCAFFPEPGGEPDPENDYEVVRANAIFADASVSLLVGYDDNPRHPYIVDFESNCDPSLIDNLGFTLRDGRWRVLLSKKVKELAPKVLEPAVRRVLRRNELKIEDIRWFVVHTAGASVLDKVQAMFGINDEKMELSRSVLKDFGNCSSTTIGLIGKRLMQQEDVEEGGWVLVMSMGPGMVGGATLLKF